MTTDDVNEPGDHPLGWSRAAQEAAAETASPPARFAERAVPFRQRRIGNVTGAWVIALTGAVIGFVLGGVVAYATSSPDDFIREYFILFGVLCGGVIGLAVAVVVGLSGRR
jgi:hypothetical protein